MYDNPTRRAEYQKRMEQVRKIKELERELYL